MDNFERAQLNIYLADLANGEAGALDGIYLLCSRQMFALVRSIVKNTHDAEDIVHDTFIKIVENVDKFSSGSNGYAWIMKITRNNALEFLRKRGRRDEENIDDFFNLSDGSYDENKRDGAIMLEMAIKKLGDAEKKLIYYSYYLDMTVREIARELHVSKSAVSRQLKKAEENLKKFLGQRDN